MSESLFTTETPATNNNSDGTPGITTAVNLKFAVAGTVDVRWYCTTNTGGTWTGLVWKKTNGDPDTGGGTLVASATFSGTPVGGDWNVITLGAVVNDTDYYTIGVHNDQGRYVATTHFAAYDGGAGVTSSGGNVFAPPNGTTFTLGSLFQGLFQINASPAYPANSGSGSNYFIDVIFTPAGAGSVAPDGIAVSVALGAPAVSQANTVVPDSIAIPVALGAPVVSQSLAAAPNGIAVPLTLGAPSVAMAVNLPGIVVPLAIGDLAVDGPRTVAVRGNWDSLLGILASARADAAVQRERLEHPIDCPEHQWPLQRVSDGVYHCIFGGHVVRGM